MARTLESLSAGTPVWCGDLHVADVRALYTEGESRGVEWIVIRWNATGQDLALPAVEVESIDERGVELMQKEVAAYDSLAAFEPARFPAAHPLS